MAFDPSKYITKPLKQIRWGSLLLGASGRGKTFQYRTLVDAGYKPLYLASEKKAGTIADLNPDTIVVGKPDYPIREQGAAAGESDLFDIFQWLLTGKHDYDVVFWDGPMRECEDLLTYLKEVKNLGGQDLWGAFAEKCEKMVKKYISLTNPSLPKPIHVIATWGVEKEKDWTGTIGVQPLVDGQKFKPRMPYLFENILGLDRVMDPVSATEDYVMYTMPTKGMDCKISAGGIKFPAIIKQPSIGAILRRLEASVGATATGVDATSKGSEVLPA